MTEHHLSVSRTARYYTLGELTEHTTDVWFVLHGYGQLARYFLRRFDVVSNERTFVVAPEGLSRFYLDEEYGKMGASWMTREDRQHEIDDYIIYLNTLYRQVLADTADSPKLRITLMGFSQGCATVCRWLNAGQVGCHRLLLWAGYFPNGLKDVIALDTLKRLPVQYVYGRQDELMKQLGDVDAYLHRLKTEVPHLELIPFDGKHTVEREVLREIV